MQFLESLRLPQNSGVRVLAAVFVLYQLDLC